MDHYKTHVNQQAVNPKHLKPHQQPQIAARGCSLAERRASLQIGDGNFVVGVPLFFVKCVVGYRV